MIITVEKSLPRGTAIAPPSKSMAHRLLICAGLSGQPCTVEGVQLSQDVQATLDCLRTLGADVRIEGDTVSLTGGDPFASPGEPVFCRESGSTLRFFIPILLLGSGRVTVEGSPRLMERPMEPYAALCRERSLLFRQEDNKIYLRGALTPGLYSVPGNISSQFVSGLLFAMPLLESGSVVQLIPPVSSRAYIEMTRAAQRQYGVTSVWTDENTLRIPGGQRYVPCAQRVEGDWSNAAFLEGWNLLDGAVTVDNLNPNSIQGDKVYRKYYQSLQAGAPTLDVEQCPDLAPVLMALGAAKNGVTLTGTRRLRLKESDRGAAMAEELGKLGVTVTVEEDRITVPGGHLTAPREMLDGHNDHRIVMALTLLLSLVGGRLRGAEAVAKSWPDFFPVIRSLGVQAEEENA